MSTTNPKNKDLITDEPGSHPLGTGVGTLAGVTAGAVAGAAAGPAGVIIGAIAGGVAGGLAGHHVGEGLNPTEGLPPDDENVVGTGVGLTTGAIIGGTLGTPAGPLGVAAGAAIGAGLGGYAGAEAEEALDNRDREKHEKELEEQRVKAQSQHVSPLNTNSVHNPVTHRATVDSLNRNEENLNDPVIVQVTEVEAVYVPTQERKEYEKTDKL